MDLVDEEIVMVIEEFHRNGKIPYLAEIARATGIHKMTISRRLRRLEREGVVEVNKIGGYVFVTLKGYDVSGCKYCRKKYKDSRKGMAGRWPKFLKPILEVVRCEEKHNGAHI